MCDKEQLIAYVYDDLSAADRAAVDAHVRECAECRDEIAALGRTRRHLAAWAPPEPGFDLQMVRREVAVPPRRMPSVPAWAMAAAASLLLLAGAAALANLEVRLASDGVVVRTGWGSPAPAAPVQLPATGVAEDSAAVSELAGELRVLQARLRELEDAQAEPPDAAPAPATTDRALAAVEARLRRLIAESERRQRTDMAVQLAAVWKDFNAVRASDVMRVHESLERVQGQTNLQLRQQRDSLQSLYRISLQK